MVQLWSIKRRMMIGGSVLIVLGLIIYAVKGFTPVLALPVLGAVIIIAGVLYNPKKKEKTIIND
jgi:uncharacterized membrane protein HdeD (DUF308 family)